jgi:hypothetical protein
MQRYWFLEQMVHVVTTGLQRVKRVVSLEEEVQDVS